MYHFTDGSNLCVALPHLFARQAAAASLSADLEKPTTGHLLAIFIYFQCNKDTFTICSSKKDRRANHSIYFSCDQSLELQVFTISCNQSWADHASKAYHLFKIFDLANSFLCHPQLITVWKLSSRVSWNMAPHFGLVLMLPILPPWALVIYVVRVIGMSHQEAVSGSTSCSPLAGLVVLHLFIYF